MSGIPFDPLGANSLAKSVQCVTEGTVKGAGNLLSRICLPAAEEFGYLIQDKVKHWRARNVEKTLEKANSKLPSNDNLSAHPRIVCDIIEKSSWIDDDYLQEMWAGLLASSCENNNPTDDNLIFVNILNQLTSGQVRILCYACENAKKYANIDGLPSAEELRITVENAKEIMGIQDIQRVDRELDYLRMLELIGTPGAFGNTGGGIMFNTGMVHLRPSCIALHLYVRANGSRLPPHEYFSLPLRNNQQGDVIDLLNTIEQSTGSPTE